MSNKNIGSEKILEVKILEVKLMYFLLGMCMRGDGTKLDQIEFVVQMSHKETE